jgi:hypothetical protein
MTQPDDRPIRWGILATGGIAHAFAHDLALQGPGGKPNDSEVVHPDR